MDSNIAILILVIITVLFCLSAYIKHVQKNTLNKVAMLTYSDPEKVFEVIESFPNNLVIPKRERLLMMLDPYIIMDNQKGIDDTVADLRKCSLSDLNIIGMDQKLLAYYSIRGNLEKGEPLYFECDEKLKIPTIAKQPKYQQIKQESDQLYYIYLKHDVSWLKKEIALAESTDEGPIKGVYLFRVAKLYYYDNNLKNMEEYLQKSAKYCKGSKLESIIRRIQNGDYEAINSI